MFQKWLNLAKYITEFLPKVPVLDCPKCNNKSIDFQYVGDMKTRIGYLDIWCTLSHADITVIHGTRR